MLEADFTQECLAAFQALIYCSRLKLTKNLIL